MVCAFLPSDPLAPPPRPPSLASLLEASKLFHLQDALSSISFENLDEMLSDKGRLAFLHALRELGVKSLSERQSLANALGRHQREAALRRVQQTPMASEAVTVPFNRPDLESAAELAAATTWVPLVGTRSSSTVDATRTAASGSSSVSSDARVASRDAMQPWLRAYYDESLAEDDCMRALRLAEGEVLGSSTSSAGRTDGGDDDVAHFRQGMERQSAAQALSLMMEYKREEATQAMLSAGAKGVSVRLEPEGRDVRVWVYRLM